MRYLLGLLLVIGLMACGGESTTESDLSTSTDSTTIVEYEMDNERLSAVEYNNEFTLMQQQVLDQIDVLFKSDTGNVVTNHQNALFEVNLKLNDLERMNPPQGGEQFKNALNDLFVFYKKQLNGDFEAVMPIMQKAEISEQENEALETFSEQFALKEDSLFQNILSAQETFAAENNFVVH